MRKKLSPRASDSVHRRASGVHPKNFMRSMRGGYRI